MAGSPLSQTLGHRDPGTSHGRPVPPASCGGCSQPRAGSWRAQLGRGPHRPPCPPATSRRGWEPRPPSLLRRPMQEAGPRGPFAATVPSPVTECMWGRRGFLLPGLRRVPVLAPLRAWAFRCVHRPGFRGGDSGVPHTPDGRWSHVCSLAPAWGSRRVRCVCTRGTQARARTAAHGRASRLPSGTGPPRRSSGFGGPGLPAQGSRPPAPRGSQNGRGHLE